MDSTTAGLVTELGTNLAHQAATNGHGRKFRDQADEVGLYYMVEAGYDYMEAPEVWRVFGRYTQDQDKVSNFFFSDHSTQAARIKNLTKAINADYRAQVPRTTLRTGEEEYHKAAERLNQQKRDGELPEPAIRAGVLYELRDVNRAAQPFERYLQLAPDAPEAPKIRAFLNAIRVPPQ
jgi:predicted Zn-dependent protease